MRKKAFFLFALLLFLAVMILPAGAQKLGKAAWRRYFRDWHLLETELFLLRYTEKDAAAAAWLAAVADRRAAEVAAVLPHTAKEKPWLVLVPDLATLRDIFGFAEEDGALGVYQAGAIALLSPQAWDWEAEEARFEEFVAKNPLVHEYTHYVLDVRARGNYPRWFSEGMASYLQYRLTGYTWPEEDSSLSTGPYYNLKRFTSDFASLPDQALAYCQAQSIVTYLAALQADEGLNKLLDKLGAGTAFDSALEEVYGMEAEAVFAAWLGWSRAAAGIRPKLA